MKPIGKRRLKGLAVSVLATAMVFSVFGGIPEARAATDRIPDTGQVTCYSNSGKIDCPAAGQRFFGQDANYAGPKMAYKDNGDGTVTDLVTGLMWSKAVDTHKVSLVEAEKMASVMTLGGHTDWRVPTIKELYSLINFNGYTGLAQRRSQPPDRQQAQGRPQPPDGQQAQGRPQPPGRQQAQGGFQAPAPADAVPFINTDYFDFLYGNTDAGERYIDAQWLTSTRYVSTTMGGAKTLFGVNFADGRIKGYGYLHPDGRRPEKKFYVRFVRGSAYGQNDFKDNGDGTVTDRATGLVWMKADSGRKMTWQEALAYAEKLKLAGHGDWRLPNAKELQYIVDYTRSPDTTNSAAIDPIFASTPIKNEAGQTDYGHYWTSTTHLDGPRPGAMGAYVAFGRAMGEMRGRVMDVHGAGAQRSDPKVGTPGIGHGPQGDARRIYNLVRCVRGGSAEVSINPPQPAGNGYPAVVRIGDETRAVESPSGGFNRPAQGRMEDSGNIPGQGPGQPPAGRRPPDGADFVKRLDKDGNGCVSRAEFDGPPQHFNDFDRNRDGCLTEDEAPKGPPPRRNGQRRVPPANQ